jgi:hypothetical protein
MSFRRLLTISTDNDPPWIRPQLQQVADRWAAMIVGDDVVWDVLKLNKLRGGRSGEG